MSTSGKISKSNTSNPAIGGPPTFLTTVIVLAVNVTVQATSADTENVTGTLVAGRRPQHRSR